MRFLTKKFRNIKKLPTWIFLPPALLLKFIKTFCLKTTILDPNNYAAEARATITVTWHNRLCFFPALFPAPTRKRTVAVVSASRDGQYITDLISHFGLRSLRGSSSKKGASAQREAIKALKEGFHVSFTPDGPRGPKYRMSRGPIHLASLTGRPIIPITINASRYWQIKSWDNFQIPKPGAKLTLILSDMIYIPPNLDEAGIEKWRRVVEAELMKITED
ncbi:MAG: lysophospholipid acyltransferase family protein [Victivallaceae bacterium]